MKIYQKLTSWKFMCPTNQSAHRGNLKWQPAPLPIQFWLISVATEAAQFWMLLLLFQLQLQLQLELA